jgi:Xaa-Pro aminopeptidase
MSNNTQPNSNAEFRNRIASQIGNLVLGNIELSAEIETQAAQIEELKKVKNGYNIDELKEAQKQSEL